EAIPDLTYGVPLGAACKLTFSPNGGTQVQGNISPLSFDTANAQPLATPLDFADCDFTSTQLQFKAFGGLGCNGYECGSDHLMNDDVINRRVLIWNVGNSVRF